MDSFLHAPYIFTQESGEAQKEAQLLVREPGLLVLWHGALSLGAQWVWPEESCQKVQMEILLSNDKWERDQGWGEFSLQDR